MFVEGLRQLCTQAASAAMPSNSKSGKVVGIKSDPTTVAIIFMAFLCAVLPLDISQLAFAILGAGLYALLQKSDHLKPKKQQISVVVEATPQNRATRTPKQKTFSTRQEGSTDKGPAETTKPVTAPVAVVDSRGNTITPSVQPVVAPTFQSDGWEGEVQELLLQITPTRETEQTITRLVQIVKHTLRKMIPEVEVDGFAHGNLTFGKAFGVAVPEVDIIANVSPQALFSCHRLHSNESRSGASLDPQKIQKNQKSAIRVFTDQLVSSGGFKFRRSAFRGQEPKVTLLAPASLGLFSESIPIDFYVNAVTPLYNTALLTECGRMDSRAKELVLLVKRWAKDRGICHAAKGHLSPYVWSHLAIYFLQVGDSEEAPLLPPVEQFKISSGLLHGKRPVTDSPKQSAQAQTTAAKKSVAVLFKDFVHFFETQFDWRNEAVSIRAAKRAPPGPKVPLHIIALDDNTAATQVGPTIEDPFHAAQNLGDGMNAQSLARLREELSRAEELCSRAASLSELLEPWAPPAEPQDQDEHGGGVAQLDEARRSLVTAKKSPEMVVTGEDWRRDAVEAQAAAAVRPPPWRRPGTSGAAVPKNASN